MCEEVLPPAHVGHSHDDGNLLAQSQVLVRPSSTRSRYGPRSAGHQAARSRGSRSSRLSVAWLLDLGQDHRGNKKMSKMERGGICQHGVLKEVTKCVCFLEFGGFGIRRKQSAPRVVRLASLSAEHGGEITEEEEKKQIR